MTDQTPDTDPSTFTFRAAAEDIGARVDTYLANQISDCSRARIQRLIEDGDVLVDGRLTKASYKLRLDDEVEVELTPPRPFEFIPENIPIDVIYEDDEVIVINKAAGMVVHPAAGNASGTLANALAYRFEELPIADHEELRISDFGLRNEGDHEGSSSQMHELSINTETRTSPDQQSAIRNPQSTIPSDPPSNSVRPGIVHRLDKDTSGLIVVAKTEGAHEKLSDQFREREVFKSYVALVHGRVTEDTGRIEQPIARDPRNRTRMAVVRGGRPALSLFRVRSRYDRFTLLDIEIKTGRTHQIRVHLQWLKHPVVGDALYGDGRDNTVQDPRVRARINSLERQFLHAEKLGFRHPMTGKQMRFSSPLPPELANLVEALE